MGPARERWLTRDMNGRRSGTDTVTTMSSPSTAHDSSCASFSAAARRPTAHGSDAPPDQYADAADNAVASAALRARDRQSSAPPTDATVAISGSASRRPSFPTLHRIASAASNRLARAMVSWVEFVAPSCFPFVAIPPHQRQAAQRSLTTPVAARQPPPAGGQDGTVAP